MPSPTPKPKSAASERPQSQDDQDPEKSNTTETDSSNKDTLPQDNATATSAEQLSSETLPSDQTVEPKSSSPTLVDTDARTMSNAKTSSPKVTKGGPASTAMGGTVGSNSSTHQSGKYSAYTAVHVSHVESPACIYVQLSTAGKDGLDR